MRKSNSLSFVGEHKKNTKRFRTFIIAFCAFVVVLGSVSLLMFMKHIDYDLNNIVSAAQTTTDLSVTETTQPVKLEGRSDVLLICENSDKTLEFVFVVTTDYSEMKMTVCCIPNYTALDYNSYSGTIAGLYESTGAADLSAALNKCLGIRTDRYIKFSITRLQSFAAKFEDVTVTLETDIDDSASGLILSSGEQSLSTEMFIKYLKYCDDYHRADAFAQFLKLVFSQRHSVKLEEFFSYVANNSQTDITIVDFKAHQDNLIAFSNADKQIYAVSQVGATGGEADE